MLRSPVKTNRFLRWCSEIQDKHWILSLLLVKLSAVWFSLIIGFWGETLHLVISDSSTGAKKFTFWGGFFTIVILALIILGEASKKYMQFKTPPRFEIGAYKLLSNLRYNINAYCNNKYRHLLTKLELAKKRQPADKHLVCGPIEAVDQLAHEMEKCLQALLDEGGPQPKDVFVGIIYQLPLENDPTNKDRWYWGIKDEKGLNLEKLLNVEDQGRKSTLRHLLDQNTNYVFFNSKRAAYEKNVYIIDELDNCSEPGNGNNSQPYGSIACHKGSVKRNDVIYFNYVIMITTYSTKFSEDEDSIIVNNVQYNIEKYIIPDFETRIKNEICSFYLESLQ